MVVLVVLVLRMEFWMPAMLELTWSSLLPLWSPAGTARWF